MSTIISSAASVAAATSVASQAEVASIAALSPPAFALELASVIRTFTPDALANGAATLIGALLGAMLAYVLQRKFQSLQNKNAELMAAHRMMFAILQQINTLLLIQKDHVFSEIKNPGRFISIPALSLFDVEKNSMQMADLSFLIEDSKGRLILYDLFIAQENYTEALKIWNLRSTMHSEQLQPAIAAAKIVNGTAVTHETIESAIGTLVFKSMINVTDNSIEALHRAFIKLRDVKIKARAYLVERFKNNDFIDFDFPETFGLDVMPAKIM